MVLNVHGYRVVQFKMDSQDFGPSSFVYMKAHGNEEMEKKRSEDELIKEKTLFVVNIPIGISLKQIRAIFTRYGPIQKIIELRNTPPKCNLTPRKVYIIYKTETSLEQVLAETLILYPEDKSLIAKKSTKSNIVAELKKEYFESKLSADELKIESDRFMRQFEEKEEQERIAREKLKNSVDEDGFQTVVNVNSVKKESIVAPLRKRKKQKNKELQNFYSFQMREKKRQKLHDLRARFIEDQKRVEELKKKRTFRPRAE